MIPRDMIAGPLAMMLVLGHAYMFYILQTLTSISPDMIIDLTQLILPITAVGAMSSVTFIHNTRKRSLKKGPRVNFIYAFFVTIVPATLFVYLLYNVHGLDNEQAAHDFKATVTTIEILFGTIYASLIVSLFDVDDKGRKKC